MAGLVLEISQVMNVLRNHCPDFDDMRGGAVVVARAETAVQRAQAVAAH